MRKTLLNKYAIRKGKVVHIDDLSRTFERGRNARCLCPGCNKELSARFPEGRKAHFVHVGKPCEENEYLLNLLYYILRDAIEEKDVFYTPGIHASYKYLPPRTRLHRDNIEKNVKFDKKPFERAKELLESKWNHCGSTRFYVNNGEIKALIIQWKNYEYNFAVVFSSGLESTPYNVPSQNIILIDVDSLNFDGMNLDNIKYMLRSDKIDKKWVKHYKLDKFIDESMLAQEKWVQTQRKKNNAESMAKI